MAITQALRGDLLGDQQGADPEASFPPHSCTNGPHAALPALRRESCHEPIISTAQPSLSQGKKLTDMSWEPRNISCNPWQGVSPGCSPYGTPCWSWGSARDTQGKQLDAEGRACVAAPAVWMDRWHRLTTAKRRSRAASVNLRLQHADERFSD